VTKATKMSDNDTSRFGGTAESGERTAEKESLQTTAESSQGRCRPDASWELVGSRHEQQRPEKLGRRQSTVCRTDLMALDSSPDLFAHRFYVLVLFFSVLVIPTCGRLSWPTLWSTFGRTIG